MTNFEYIKQAINDEKAPQKLSDFLCDHIFKVIEKHIGNNDIDVCEFCPFTDRCRRGHNGVFDYLMEEVSENG